MQIDQIVKETLGAKDVDAGAAMYSLANTLIVTGAVIVAFAALSPLAIPISLTLLLTALFIALMGVGLISGGIYMYQNWQISIPTNHVGIPLIWDDRRPQLRREGKVMLGKPWPFEFDRYLTTDLESQVEKFSFEVQCGAQKTTASQASQEGSLGSIATVDALVTYQADDSSAERIICYQNRGGPEKVKKMVTTIFDDVVSDIALNYDIEQFQHLKSRIDVLLLVLLTGFQLRNLGAPPANLSYPQTIRDITERDYENLPVIDDPLGHLSQYDFAPDGESPADKTQREKLKRLREQEIAIYLRLVLSRGRADNHDLGVRFTQVKINNIKGDDAFQKASSDLQAEKKQRQAEREDRITRLNLARLAVEESRPKDANGNPIGEPTISFEQAYQDELVQNKNINKSTTVLEVPGLRELAAGIPGIIQAILNKKE